MYKIIRLGKNLKKFATDKTSQPEDGGKLFCIVQPVTFRQKINNTNPQEVLKNFRSGLELNSQAFTAFGTASPNYSSSTAGLHTNQETMGALPPSDGWLIGTLHFSSKG